MIESYSSFLGSLSIVGVGFSESRPNFSPYVSGTNNIILKVESQGLFIVVSFLECLSSNQPYDSKRVFAGFIELGSYSEAVRKDSCSDNIILGFYSHKLFVLQLQQEQICSEVLL